MREEEPLYDVAICGYGPAGELCANLLGQQGHSVLVLERTDASVFPLPRAVAMDAEVLRLLQLVELGEPLAERMLELPGAEFVTATGERILGADYPPATALGWAPAHIYHQPNLEIALRERAERLAGVQVRYGCEVTGFSQSGESVLIETRSADGESGTFAARFLLGCDGASSFVRRHADLGSEDLGFDQNWLVVDVIRRRRTPLPTLAQQICDPRRRTTFVPGVADRARWEFQLVEGETREQMEDPARVFELLEPWVSEENVELERAVVYRFHAVLARRWRRDRCFVLGDAAHQMPPFLGQGLCSGARDAFNLCWKLDLVLRGRASEGLLDSYETERRPHAIATVELSVGIGRLIDRLAAATAGGLTAGLELAASGYGGEQELPSLTRGLLVSESGPLVGRPCPQPWVVENESRRRLDDLLGPGFAILAREDPSRWMSDESRAFWRAIGGSLVDLSVGRCEPDLLAAAFATHDALVVRPDRYVFAQTRERARAAGVASLDAAISMLRDAFS